MSRNATDDPSLPEPVGAVIQRGLDLHNELVATAEPGTELLRRARQAIEDAHKAGRLAWSYKDRDQLDFIVRRNTRVLEDAGESVPKRLQTLAKFDGAAPKFEFMSQEDFTAAVKAGDEIVGRRLDGPFDQDTRHRDYRGARIYDCAFIGWNFDDADLRDARIAHTSFQSCSFQRARVTGAFATTCLFAGTEDERSPLSLRGSRANFSASHFIAADLRGARLHRAAFSYGLLSDVHADGTTQLTETSFDMALIEGMSARDADLTRSIFVGANLVNVDLSGSTLAGAVFSSARMVGLGLREANLEKAKLASAYYVALADFGDSIWKADLSEHDRELLEKKLAEHRPSAVNPVDPGS